MLGVLPRAVLGVILFLTGGAARLGLVRFHRKQGRTLVTLRPRPFRWERGVSRSWSPDVQLHAKPAGCVSDRPGLDRSNRSKSLLKSPAFSLAPRRVEIVWIEHAS